MIKLNPQQKAAVETDSKNALVIAGAGSGKTRVLIERIAHLIEKKEVSPFEIMAFTFTRKAAGEINSRLENRVPDAYKCTTGTMHSIAFKFIARFGELIRVNQNVTIYSEWESSELISHIINDLNTTTTKKEIIKTLEIYYQTGRPPEETSSVYSIFKTFLGRCRENNAMTYGMLLVEFMKLIPKITGYVDFKHLLVDEVQDIDPLQWQIINEIRDKFGTDLFIVGDIDQSIYEFRGAIPNYLVENQGSFDIFNLAINYRSDKHIIDYANSLIDHNKNRISKSSIAYREPRKRVDVLPNMRSEKIVELCKTLMDKYPDQRIAVLSRYHFLLNKTDKLLKDAGIERTYVGKQISLANSKEFRIFHAFLKLMVNPRDNFAFLLIKNYLGIDDSDYLEIRKKAAAELVLGHPTGHFGAYLKIDHMPKPSFFYSDATDPPWIFASQIKAEIDELDQDDSIFKFIEAWSSDNPKGGIKEYLEWLSILDIQDEIKDNYDGIQLMTVHAAKGLEWPIVIVAGCNEGLLPSQQAIKSGLIESERRLAYVAWTRAERKLILTIRPENSEFHGKKTHNPISRFIRESEMVSF